mmetsp:Transcript_7700/g.13089  ORF Transcript_7700/g.13089 Transcript_7700/m.13089 type:complete len:242 (+) Transcript_7700:924-1649(+)
MDGITEQSDVALGPWLEHRWRPVVQVALLDLMLLRCDEDIMDLGRPSNEEILQVHRAAVGFFLRRLRVSRARKESVPLVAPTANVSDDEVLLRPDVDLVAALRVAPVVVELTREDGITRVSDARLIAACGGVGHRGTHIRPDAVGANENVADNLLTAVQLGGYTAIAVLHVRLHARTKANVVGCAAHENLLQLWPLNNTCERHAPALGRRFEIEFSIPLISDAIFDPIGAVARPRRPLLNL